MEKVKQEETAVRDTSLPLLYEFVQDASNQFKSILAAVSMNAYMMKNFDDAKQRQVSLESIEHQAQLRSHLADILLNIITFENVESFVWETVSVDSLVNTLCAGKTDEMNAQFELPPNLPPITGDYHLLAKALNHILCNAHYVKSEDSGIYVSLSAQISHIRLQILTSPSKIIGARFMQDSKTSWWHEKVNELPDFGLSLCIAQWIIERHKGHISAWVEKDQSIVFIVDLPVVGETF